MPTLSLLFVLNGLLRWCNGKEPICQRRRCKRHEFDPWVRMIPWSRKWQPTPVFLPGESHGQGSLVGSNPWGGSQKVRHDYTCMSSFVLKKFTSFWNTLYLEILFQPAYRPWHEVSPNSPSWALGQSGTPTPSEILPITPPVALVLFCNRRCRCPVCGDWISSLLLPRLLRWLVGVFRTLAVTNRTRYFSDSGDQRWKHWANRLWLKSGSAWEEAGSCRQWMKGLSIPLAGTATTSQAPEDAQGRGPSSQAGTWMTRGLTMGCEFPTGRVRACLSVLHFRRGEAARVIVTHGSTLIKSPYLLSGRPWTNYSPSSSFKFCIYETRFKIPQFEV